VGEEPLLLIISSASGAGKTTLARDLLKNIPSLGFSVSHTTRKARPSEVEGVHYYFVDKERFRQLIKQNAFAEWAEVHGNFYGTSFGEIERFKKEGKQGILFDIDYQGARQIKAACPEAVAVFVLPPSIGELRKRLTARGDMGDEAIDRRISNATNEIEHYGCFDYLIVNDDLEKACTHLRAIVHAEQSRRQRMAPVAETLLRSSNGVDRTHLKTKR
jgi:guanylate kinase